MTQLIKFETIAGDTCWVNPDYVSSVGWYDFEKCVNISMSNESWFNVEGTLAEVLDKLTNEKN